MWAFLKIAFHFETELGILHLWARKKLNYTLYLQCQNKTGILLKELTWVA